MTKVSDIFNVEYGNSLELNKLKQSPHGINFVSRTSENNGISAKVAAVPSLKSIPAGTITVSLGGSVLEAFLQPSNFYTGFHIYCLTPKLHLTDQQKLFYCTCIRANKYRYNYGRQANRTLKDLKIPAPEEIPKWINKIDVTKFEKAKEKFTDKPIKSLETRKWEWFELQKIFDLKKGKRLTKLNMRTGKTPYIGAIDSNNGYRQLIDHKPIHDGNTITVNYNGSVAEAFYQPSPFWATDDVNVLYPKFRMNRFTGLFICTVIKKEKYRFNYGRKWHLERMRESKVKLPVTKAGTPDFELMENYIKCLPFSRTI